MRQIIDLGGHVRRGAAVLLAVAVLLITGGAPALADGPSAGADVHVAQTLGERELTVTLRRVDGVPGPLRVDVVTHTGSPAGQLGLELVPTGVSTAPAEDGGVSEAVVQLGAAPGTYGATLDVERAGPHELIVDDGTRTASIPFVVPVTVLSPAEEATYGGFAAAGLFLALALVAAVTVRHTWVAVVPAAGLVASLAVAVSAALLSASTPAPPVPGDDVDASEASVLDPYSVAHLTSAQASRPPVTLVTTSEASGTGAVDLVLSLTDGASGQPVDDLLVQHDAFVHLVVVAPSTALHHVHPVRVAPGEYRVRLATAEPGHYAVAAEVARRGGGIQQLRSSFDVGQAAAASAPATQPAAEPAGPGVRDVAGTRAEVSVTGARSSEPTTVTVRFGDDADLQPWLGMVGHLFAVGPLPEDATATPAPLESAPVWVHAHAMPRQVLTAEGPPDETVAAHGPEVTFTLAFPLPGRYRVWVQAQRDYTLLTVPVLLDVAAPRPQEVVS